MSVRLPPISIPGRKIFNILVDALYESIFKLPPIEAVERVEEIAGDQQLASVRKSLEMNYLKCASIRESLNRISMAEDKLYEAMSEAKALREREETAILSALTKREQTVSAVKADKRH